MRNKHRIRDFRGSNSRHLVQKEGGGLRPAKNYEIVVGRLATMVDVERNDMTLLLFAVIETAIRDVSGANPAFYFDAEDFTFNHEEAKGFLFGFRGQLYYDALGIDPEQAHKVIRQYLTPELDGVMPVRERKTYITRAQRAGQQILRLLAKRSTVDIESIANELDIRYTLAERALKQLEVAGLIDVTPIPRLRGSGGRRRGYSLKRLQEAA